jgi:hypothetical protein
MASSISAGNATNGVVVSSDNTGALNLITGSGSGTTAVTIDSSQNVSIPKGVGGTPAFSANDGATTQSVANTTFTLLTFGTELFDTNSAFNNTGSTVGGVPAYAFMPTIAGYYQVNAGSYSTLAQNISNSAFVSIYKNGTEVIRGAWSVNAIGIVSALIYLNGTTDYIQIYAYQTNTTAATITFGASAALKYFQASMTRGA